MSLGLLYLAIVRYKQHIYGKNTIATKNISPQIQKVGIPQQFGMFYALGLALFTEGILSLCYHICPTFQNFQFDTTFRYVIAILMILKIYQFRHPDVTANAYKIFTGISIVLFLEVIGIKYQDNTLFWVFMSLIYFYVTVTLAPILYKSGQWKNIWQGYIVSLQVKYQLSFFLLDNHFYNFI